MARRSQCSSAGDNPLDPNYLPPHYREEYRLAVDALVEEDLEGYYQFLQRADVVDFLSTPEIQYIQSSIRVPQLSSHPEQHFLEVGGDGSSDTYWPVHSDLDVPGLDLGWPQLHHFIGPAEVTTLVNPPEPDMPSIKEQARRLIKNAQQVIAVVMDMFTDVDMFSDIINAAMRNVAVYIILDEQNAHHFLNMASSCRVNLQSIQFMRVRTVSGITYQCRSGKSFKGQMMDRFLLTDCRAVLSGNYSFMWSFEKLHRCMAHLFLGQLVSTFDEEFRILYAQSQPLVVENVMAPMEDLSLLQKRQYPSDRTSVYRDTRKFLSMDTGHPDEWARHPHDDRGDGDWRMMALKRQESLRGPADMYGRFPSQQARMDTPFDPGHSRITMLENPAFKRHSYAEGVQGRYSHPFLQQQGMPDSELPGRHFHRGQQQPYPGHGAGPEPEYGGYDKFWNQGYLSVDQHSEPSGFPQEMQPPDNFDTVRNYLSSTRNLDVDQSSEKLPPAGDLPFGSSRPRRLSLGQVYACQTSPTPSNPTDQKDFFQEPSTDRKDPLVKRGLRNWRISSYLSAYDNPEEEGLPQAPLQPSDPFEEPCNPVQQTAPGIDPSLPKIPNVREFKVPMIPRASQMPSYAKLTPREQPKKLPDEPPPAMATEIKPTQTPSDSSSTTEGEKTEEIEPKEAKTPLLRRDDSFRRKYNAAVPKSSRLRSSLIFSSLDQQQTPQDPTTATGDQQEEDGEKTEADQTKLPFVSHVLGQRRSAAREPFQWTRYLKSATIDTPSTETSKPDDDGSSKDKNLSKEESSKDLTENPAAQESLKPPDVEQANVSPSQPRPKPPEAELPKPEQLTQPSKPLLTTPLYVDMNDPDSRFMFFKELAAKRKAAKAAEAEKSKEKAPMKTPADPKGNTDVKKEEPVPKETPENKASASEGSLVKNDAAESPEKTVSTESVSPSSDVCKETKKQDSLVKNDPKSSQSFKEEQTKVTADSEMTKPEDNLSAASLPEASQSKSSPQEPNLSSPAVEKSDTSHPPTPTDATPANASSPAQGSDESGNQSLDSTSKESAKVPVLSVTSAALPPPSSEQDTGSENSSSNPAVKSPSTDQAVPDSGSQNSSSPSSSAPPSTPVETKSSNITPEDSHTAPASSLPSPKVDKTEAQESVSSSSQDSSKPAVETLQKTENLSDHANGESVSQKTSSESPSAVDCAHVESDIPPDTCAAGSEPNTSSSESDTKTESEDVSAATPSEKDASESVKDISESKKDATGSETQSLPQTVAEESEVLTLSKDVKADSTSTVAPSGPDSDLPAASALESSASKTESEEATPPPADSPPEHLPSETSSPVSTGSASQSETTATAPEAPPSDLNVTGGDAPVPAETQSLTPPPNESVGSVLSPEAEKTETNTSALQSLSDTDSLSKEAPPQSDKAPENPSAKPPSGPIEPTSTVPAEVDLPPCKTPETVTPESHTPEPPVPAENSQIEPEGPDPADEESVNPEDMKENHKGESQESVSGEKPNDQVKQSNCSEPTEVTSKQPKSNQSRYHSSTANVLSSSNLRDDTKLLLEKISANSQSRSEATKESPVTDDEKEDEADKNAKREKERGISALNRGQPKSTQEREKLLERIQSIRKERKVYSRFEV